MTNYKIDRVKSVQILDKDTLKLIADWDGIGNATIETEVEPSSFANEVLSFNHSASFKGELINYSLASNLNSKPLYVEYYIPILIQARWHKKHRINKKWLKRYGMKEDKVLVRCDVDSITPDNSYDPYYPCDPIEFNEFNVELSNMQYKFRPDQLRRNLKIVMHYE